MQQFQSSWYAWGALLSFTIALLTLFGVFSHAPHRHGNAIFWRPLLGVGMPTGPRCANCGKPCDPSWPFCPACEYDMPAAPATYDLAAGRNPSGPTMPLPVVDRQPTRTLPGAPPATMPFIPEAGTVQGGSDGATRLMKTTPAALACWVIGEGVHQGRAFQLGEITNIGRKADINDIIVDDDDASRQHARVRLEGGQFVLYDLASGNGTFVRSTANGAWERIQKRTLVDGMNIKIGKTVYAFMGVRSGKEE